MQNLSNSLFFLNLMLSFLLFAFQSIQFTLCQNMPLSLIWFTVEQSLIQIPIITFSNSFVVKCFTNQFRINLLLNANDVYKMYVFIKIFCNHMCFL